MSMGTPMGAPIGLSQCYGRTDGRTKTVQPIAIKAEAVTHGRVSEDPARLSELLDPAVLWPTERHPVIRSGERAEIPPHVRAAVWYRDRGKCELCGTTTPDGQPWHLDHITPWSAGGSDETHNLRVLCERHNMDRGNRIDSTERERRPATWWCLNCYDLDDWRWSYDNGFPTCLIHNVDITHPYAWRCTVVRAYKAAWQRDRSLPDWHHIQPLEGGSTIAYCAHCNAPGLTGRPL